MNVRFWLALTTVTAVAAWDLSIGLRAGPEPVPQAEFKDARRALEARTKRGDVIVHSPLFGVSEVRHLDGIAARPDLPVEAVRRNRRVLLLDHRAAPMHGFGPPDDQIFVGPHVSVATFEPEGTGEVPVYDLVIDLGPDTMRIERPVGKLATRCRTARSGGGFRCPGQAEWVYAAARTLRIGGVEQECLWAHPVSGAAIVFSIPPQTAPAAGRQLVVEVQAALTDDAVRQTPNGATVTTAVKQKGRTLGRVRVPNRVGWRQFSGPIEPGAAIELETTAPQDGRRHYCVQARVADRAIDEEKR